MPAKKNKQVKNQGYYHDNYDSVTDKGYMKGYFKDHQDSEFSNAETQEDSFTERTGGYYKDMDKDILAGIAPDEGDISQKKRGCGKSCPKEGGKCCENAVSDSKIAEPIEQADKILYFDMSFGVSGDMLCAALLDISVMSLSELKEELSKLNISDEYDVGTQACKDLPYHALSFEVHVKGDPHSRCLSDILDVIDKSGLADSVKRIATGIFFKLAEAEAGVHECDIMNVTFHECGAVDSIIDIAASAILLDRLSPSAIYSNSFNLGGGIIECGCGELPVPAPATAALLRGYNVCFRGDFEKTTPTGAAIMTSVLTAQTSIFDGKLLAYGRGVGTRGGGALSVYLLRSIAKTCGEEL